MPQFVFSTNCGIFGRGDGDRTHDLSVPNAARYQLRYASSQILFSEIHRRCFFIASTNASIITNTREKVNLFHTKTKNSFYFFFNLFRPNHTTDFPSRRKNLWIQTKNIHMPCHCLTQRSLLFCIIALFLIRVCFFKIT